jgi:hypothetical protein
LAPTNVRLLCFCMFVLFEIEMIEMPDMLGKRLR